MRSELRKKIGEIRKYSINQQVTVGKENEGTVLYICMNFFKGTVSREKCSNWDSGELGWVPRMCWIQIVSFYAMPSSHDQYVRLRAVDDP